MPIAAILARRVPGVFSARARSSTKPTLADGNSIHEFLKAWQAGGTTFGLGSLRGLSAAPIGSATRVLVIHDAEVDAGAGIHVVRAAPAAGESVAGPRLLLSSATDQPGGHAGISKRGATFGRALAAWHCANNLQAPGDIPRLSPPTSSSTRISLWIATTSQRPCGATS